MSDTRKEDGLKALGAKTEKTVKAISTGETAPVMRVNGKTTSAPVKVHSNMPTVTFISDSGLMTYKTVAEYTSSRAAMCMRETMYRESAQVQASSNMPTATSM